MIWRAGEYAVGPALQDKYGRARNTPILVFPFGPSRGERAQKTAVMPRSFVFRVCQTLVSVPSSFPKLFVKHVQSAG
jgi:hypothetical protein